MPKESWHRSRIPPAARLDTLTAGGQITTDKLGHRSLSSLHSWSDSNTVWSCLRPQRRRRIARLIHKWIKAPSPSWQHQA